MKKSIAAILAGALCLSALTACGGGTSSSDSSAAANTGDSDKVITVGAALFTYEMLMKALESGAADLDGLVAAAVAAGAQKGIAVTNKIYAINDGAAAFMALCILEMGADL